MNIRKKFSAQFMLISLFILFIIYTLISGVIFQIIKFNEYKSEISSLNKEISDTKKEIENLSNTIKENEGLLGERLKVIDNNYSMGYIKVILKESNKNKGGFINLKSNEITIMFKSDYNELAKVLFEEIGIKIDELAESTSVESTVEQIKIQQIKEFKELLDEGIITQEEFDKKKQELLR